MKSHARCNTYNIVLNLKFSERFFPAEGIRKTVSEREGYNFYVSEGDSYQSCG